MNIQEMLEKTAKKTTGLHSKLKQTTYVPPDQRPWDDDFKNNQSSRDATSTEPKDELAPKQELALKSEQVPKQELALKSEQVPKQELALKSEQVPKQELALKSEQVPKQELALKSELVPKQELALKSELAPKQELALNKNQLENRTSSKLGAVKNKKIDLTSIELLKRSINEIRLMEIIKANTNGPNEKVRLGRVFLIENGIPKSLVTSAINALTEKGEITHEHVFCEEKRQNVNVFSWIK